jgi:S-layer like family, C-terminal region
MRVSDYPQSATFRVGFCVDRGAGGLARAPSAIIAVAESPMQSTAQNGTQLAKVVETDKDFARFQQHLKEVIEGEAFKGSQRSGQFLSYIVEESLAGRLAALKERVIGVKLFGRSPSYDTGEDAIVRVTASDVRRRLLQHYGKYGITSEFRISLPLGTYIPEITREPQKAASLPDPVPAAEVPPTTAEPVPAPHIVLPVETTPARPGKKWLLIAALAVACNALMWGIVWNHFSRPADAPVSILPWSAFFQSQRSTKLITSDPNIVDIQEVTGAPVSLSDYANQRYIPNLDALSPQVITFCKFILRGDKAAGVDARVIASVAGLSQRASKKISVQVARDVRLSDLSADENFIFLGSPRSNLWTNLFNDQLDFRFAFDQDTHQEIIRNVHPRTGEASSYVPSAKGWATGQSFATISFVQNPGRDGQVLILAGANGEGTQAAGELVTNVPRLSAALQHCGISSANPVKHFQILLRLNTMAGSSSNVDVLACHVL